MPAEELLRGLTLVEWGGVISFTLKFHDIFVPCSTDPRTVLIRPLCQTFANIFSVRGFEKIENSMEIMKIRVKPSFPNEHAQLLTPWAMKNEKLNMERTDPADDAGKEKQVTINWVFFCVL